MTVLVRAIKWDWGQSVMDLATAAGRTVPCGALASQSGQRSRTSVFPRNESPFVLPSLHLSPLPTS